MGKLLTIEDIKAANRAAGVLFFSRGSMRSFRSRISKAVHQGPGGVFFVTSECPPGAGGVRGVREYTVRQAFDGGARIRNVAGLSRYATLKAAHKAAARLAVGPAIEEPR